MMYTTYEELSINKVGKDVVKFNTIDKEACDAYDHLFEVTPTNVNRLTIRIQTKTESVLVESPTYRDVYSLIQWYRELEYIDPELYSYLGFINENGGFVIIAELGEKR